MFLLEAFMWVCTLIVVFLILGGVMYIFSPESHKSEPNTEQQPNQHKPLIDYNTLHTMSMFKQMQGFEDRD